MHFCFTVVVWRAVFTAFFCWMKLLRTYIIIAFSGLIFLPFVWSARLYPLQEISHPDCLWQQRDLLDSNCRLRIPSLESSNASTQVDTWVRYDQIFSVLRWATYQDGRDVWFGSHLWLDIVSAIGTPVYAIGDWEVVFAWRKNGRGNVITIKHDYLWSTIYSTYSHLATISVIQWTTISEWTIIGQVGNTWNSTGPHLHFQLETDTQSDHPYYYQNCAQGHWLDIFSVVNQWLCRDAMLEHTINPVLFLINEWVILTNDSLNSMQWNNTYTLIPEVVTNSYERWPINLVSRDDIRLRLLAANNQISYRYPWQLHISLNDTIWWSPLFLDDPVRIIVTGSGVVSAFPQTISYISSQRNVTIIPTNNQWSAVVSAFQWDSLLGQREVTIVDDRTYRQPVSAKIRFVELDNGRTAGVLVFFDRDGNRLVGHKNAFLGDIRIQSDAVCSVLFTPTVRPVDFLNQPCSSIESYRTYDDSYQWIFVFMIDGFMVDRDMESGLWSLMISLWWLPLTYTTF